MPDRPSQLARDAGLLGLVIQVHQGKITRADFDLAVSSIEETFRIELKRLARVRVIPKDKEKWEQQVLPALQEALDYQLQGIQHFHQYSQDPDENRLLHGVQLLKRSAEILLELKKPGTMSAGIQEALESAQLSGITSGLDIHQFAEGVAAAELDF